MKKKNLFLLPLFAAAGLNAQLNLPPVTSSNSSFSYFSLQTINTGNPTNLTVGTSPASGYGYVSAQAIHFPPTFHAGAATGSTGNFRAMLLNQDLPAAILYPAQDNLNAVPKFSKVEFGVNLSGLTTPDLDTRISNFLNSSTSTPNKPGSSGYNTNYQNKSILNPYDPDHISVDAVFFRPSSPYSNPIIRYGFYYKGYQPTGGPPATNWSAVADDYEWRIRFAPDETGLWTGFINVWVDGAMLPQTVTFSFTVVTSANPGNAVVDNTRPHYLKFSGDGSTYFPIGDNYCWTRESYGSNGAINTQSPLGYTNTDHRIYPTASEEMEIYLDRLSCASTGGGGGNTTRIIMAPWGFQIERERLNNYDSRQPEMSELDNIFAMMEERGVYCILALNLGVELDWDEATYDAQNTNYSEHWNWHPYFDPSTSGADPLPADLDAYTYYKGIPGVNDPSDFFSDPACKAFFKKRLRYIVSRWGYSTSLGMYELLTEISNTIYFGPNADPNAIADWHDEMYDYMRNTLQDPHIRTATFMGDDFHDGDAGQLLWSKPNIDMVSGHTYKTTEDGMRWEAGEVAGALAHNQSGWKPHLINEHDVWSFNLVTHATDWGVHNKHWASAFTGTCGSGLSWIWYGYYRCDHDFNHSHGDWNFNTNPNTGYYRGEYEKNFKTLREFTDMIDFRNYDYAPGYALNASGEFETYYLRNTNNNVVYGWTHNRSFNIYTFGEFLNTYPEGAQTYDDYQDIITYANSVNCSDNNPNTPCTDGALWEWLAPQAGSFNNDNYTGLFGTGYYPIPITTRTIQVAGLDAGADYKVDWYWTWDSGGPSGHTSNSIDDPTTTYMSGTTLNFPTPPTGSVVAGDYPGDWAFVITRMTPRLAAPAAVSIPIAATPNPSNGVFTLRSDPSEAPATIEVHALDGQLVLREEATQLDGYKLDMTGEATGVYFVTVKRAGQTSVLKIVKTAQ
jgi:hypothetical protein